MRSGVDSGLDRNILLKLKGSVVYSISSFTPVVRSEDGSPRECPQVEGKPQSRRKLRAGLSETD